MYRISICRSAGSKGSIILVKVLAEFYYEKVPDDIDSIVEEYDGDFYEIEMIEEDEHDT